MRSSKSTSRHEMGLNVGRDVHNYKKFCLKPILLINKHKAFLSEFCPIRFLNQFVTVEMLVRRARSLNIVLIIFLIQIELYNFYLLWQINAGIDVFVYGLVLLVGNH